MQMNTSACLYQLRINVSELVVKHKETEVPQMANVIRFQTIMTD